MAKILLSLLSALFILRTDSDARTLIIFEMYQTGPVGPGRAQLGLR